MGINAVTYYEVECDICHTKTGDGGEYTAWGDHGQAVDDWIDGDGVVTDDGRAYCCGCVPAGACRSNPSGHEFEDGACNHCCIDEPAVAS